jgi:hypothetical protein
MVVNNVLEGIGNIFKGEGKYMGECCSGWEKLSCKICWEMKK